MLRRRDGLVDLEARRGSRPFASDFDSAKQHLTHGPVGILHVSGLVWRGRLLSW